MSQIIDAIYEDGVFKPSQHVDVKEHEKVAIKVVPIDEWQERFNKIIKKLHDRAVHYTPEEIEKDISYAVKEVREEKSDH